MPDIIAFDFKEEELTDFSLTSGDLVNEITIKYAWNHAEGKFTSSLTKHNPLSKLLYGEAKKTLELRMIRGTRQADRIADAVLMTSSVPQLVASFVHDLRSFHVEVGDLVTITHPAGVGENGFSAANALITKKQRRGIAINYEAVMKGINTLYTSELLTISQTAQPGRAGISIIDEGGGVKCITIYADVEGSPPVEGAEVTISGVKKVTDIRGQVRFNLEPGTYTAYISASGYEDGEITFRV